MAKEKEIHEFEFDGFMFDNFGKLIEHWKDIRWGKTPGEAKSRMLYCYKDKLGKDPTKTKVVFQGIIKPTGRTKIVID